MIVFRRVVPHGVGGSLRSLYEQSRAAFHACEEDLSRTVTSLNVVLKLPERRDACVQSALGRDHGHDGSTFGTVKAVDEGYGTSGGEHRIEVEPVKKPPPMTEAFPEVDTGPQFKVTSYVCHLSHLFQNARGEGHRGFPAIDLRLQNRNARKFNRLAGREDGRESSRYRAERAKPCSPVAQPNSPELWTSSHA